MIGILGGMGTQAGLDFCNKLAILYRGKIDQEYPLFLLYNKSNIPGLKVSSIKFWSLWENNNLMGCGALKFLSKDHGEFKSIRVHDNFRNKGNGIKIIKHLINEAKNLNILRISIETGSGEFFEPARKLFISCNFQPCAPFAHYKEDVNSLYFTKLISND